MEKDAPRVLRLSGYVPHNKRRAFVQTCRFVFNQMTADCIERSLSADVFVEGYYHFFSLWRTEKHLDMFRASREFQLLIGTYIQLGLDAEKARQLW